LHWREEIPLEETLEAFSRLLEAGKVRYFGVSNFDTTDMDELVGLAGGAAVATNQVLFSVCRRGIEYDLLPWCERRSVPVMAYSPIEQGLVLHDRALRRVAAAHGALPAQMAIAWAIRRPSVLTIPKAWAGRTSRRTAARSIYASPTKMSPSSTRRTHRRDERCPSTLL
jgi:diketogulonate reductase-like aldo/keto reductase